jgi:hypothetical protein
MMLSIPRTISSAVRVAKASHTCGSVRNSIVYLQDLGH